MRVRDLVAVGVCASLLGSAPAAYANVPPPDLSTSTGLHPNVLAGEPSTSADDAIVAIRVEGLQACTGVLVAPNVVLTARHCLIEYDATSFLWCSWTPSTGPNEGDALFRKKAAESVEIVTGHALDPSTAPASARVKELFAAESLVICGGHDIGLLVLDRDIPNIDPLPLRLQPTERGSEPVAIVGWGVVDTLCRPAPTRQRRSGTVVARGPGFLRPPATEGAGEPKRVFEGEFIFSSGACTGDSGSPLISTETGAVIGLTTRIVDHQRTANVTPIYGCGNCGANLAVAGELWVERDLIERAFHAAGHAPWHEGRPRPMVKGSACEVDEDCVSGLCSAIDGTPVCVSACGDGCESNERCRADERARNVCAKQDQLGCGMTTRADSRVAPWVPCAIAFLAVSVYRRRKRI